MARDVYEELVGKCQWHGVWDGVAARRSGAEQRAAEPNAGISFSVCFALSNILVGELLTGFAMRSDPNVVFG